MDIHTMAMPLTRLMFRPCACCFVTKNTGHPARKIMRAHKRTAKRREAKIITKLMEA